MTNVPFSDDQSDGNRPRTNELRPLYVGLGLQVGWVKFDEDGIIEDVFPFEGSSECDAEEQA